VSFRAGDGDRQIGAGHVDAALKCRQRVPVGFIQSGRTTCGLLAFARRIFDDHGWHWRRRAFFSRLDQRRTAFAVELAIGIQREMKAFARAWVKGFPPK